jgi:hypothetical protein
MKTVLSALVLVAMAAKVPAAQAKPKVLQMTAGSTALWQSLALGAYDGGSCPAAGAKVKPPCFHYASSSNFNLNDLRPTKLKKKGSVITD